MEARYYFTSQVFVIYAYSYDKEKRASISKELAFAVFLAPQKLLQNNSIKTCPVRDCHQNMFLILIKLIEFYSLVKSSENLW